MKKNRKLLENYPNDLNPNYNLIGGIDECGRGAFAGPVCSSLVILPKNFSSDLVRDSKKLSEKKRELAYDLIISECLSYAISMVGVDKIDEIGIDKATYLSMENCVEDIEQKPEYLLIDGSYWSGFNDIPYSTVIKGDDTYYAIAAASIVAKVTRDRYMKKLSKDFTEYDWESNKGYYSKKHKEGLISVGGCEHHRKLFIRNHI